MRNRNRLYGLFIVLAASGFLLLLYTWHAGGHAFAASVCPINRVTGIPCPSCGTVRAVLYLLEGQFLASLRMNPLGIPALFMMITLPVWVVIDLLRNRDHLFQFFKKAEHIIVDNKWLASLLVLLILANWAWNICKGL